MELDDLRRQWQQPAPPGPALDADQLSRWQARGSGGLVAQMRRNARWEAVLTAALTVAAVGVLPGLHQTLYRSFAVTIAFLGLVLLYYSYRVLAVLGRMAAADGHVRGHLQQLCAGLRQLLRFNYRLTLAVGPATLLLIFEYAVGHELARADGFRSGRMLAVGGGLLALGVLLRVAAGYGTRWYLRRLYGRHLDRLEGNLRELNEPGPGA